MRAVLHREHGVRHVRGTHPEAGESTRLGVHPPADDRGVQVHRQLVASAHLVPHNHGQLAPCRPGV